ncbi:hypothetical protein VIGAN_03035500, partial [Vigna angularis var. angularis]
NERRSVLHTLAICEKIILVICILSRNRFDKESVGGIECNSLRCLSASHANNVLHINAVAFFQVLSLNPLAAFSVVIM